MRNPRTQIWVYSILLLNHRLFGKTIWKEKFRNFYTFQMVYCMQQSGERFENGTPNTVRKWRSSRKLIWVYLKSSLNCHEFQKTIWIKKLRNFHTFPTLYHMYQSDIRFENHPQNTIRQIRQFQCSVEKFTCKETGSSERVRE
jgi:hypothetical protein